MPKMIIWGMVPYKKTVIINSYMLFQYMAASFIVDVIRYWLINVLRYLLLDYQFWNLPKFGEKILGVLKWLVPNVIIIYYKWPDKVDRDYINLLSM